MYSPVRVSISMRSPISTKAGTDTSSPVGLMRAGYAGALAAWAGFTLPSALALIALALGIAQAG